MGRRFSVTVAVLSMICFLAGIASADDIKNRARNLFRGKTESSASARDNNSVGGKSSRAASSVKSVSSVADSVSAAPRRNNGSYDAFQLAMLSEVNFARTDPKGYAEKVLADQAAKKKDNGAYSDLTRRKPLPPLSLEPRLCAAAAKYARYLAEKNVFGHNYNGTPFQRIESEGYTYHAAGENIACGSYNEQNGIANPALAAKTFVMQLIVDDGVAGVGHRKNILSSDFTELGVGFWQNPKSDYENYAVQDFGKQ